MKRNAEIEVRDMNGARIFHGYQLENSEQWHVSGVQWSGVMIAHGAGNLATLISGQIAGMTRWSIHVHATVPGQIHPHYAVYDCYPDPMGCVVLDGEFLGYSEFMRRIIPKPVDSTPEAD